MTARWYEVWDRAYWKDYIGWLWPLGVWLQRTTARRADLIFADSALTARRLTTSAGVDPNRILVLPLAGIESLPPAPPSPKSVDCIFIGRLLHHKNVDVLLRALALLPGVTGLIIGSGPERERLVALAAELGVADRVRFESPDTHDAAIERLRSARMLVSPSTREGFGITVFEANACGVPALVVQHPDNAATELIDDDVNGFITALDPVSIADRIKSYLADPLAQSRMSQAALKAASGYSWETYVSRMEAAFESLISLSPLAGEGRGGGSQKAA